MSLIKLMSCIIKDRPPLDLCGSRLYKLWHKYAYHSDFSGLANLTALTFLLFCGVPMLFAWFVLPKPLAYLAAFCYILFGNVIKYDFNILQCLCDENAEYYRATGVTKEEVIKDKGLAGEFKAYILSKKLKVPHKTLYNLCIPMPNGSFQEVDAVIITQGHLYVLECKNRAGGFEGTIDSEYWLQHIGNEKHDVKNIFLQNREHIFAIEHFLKSKELAPLYFLSYNFLLIGDDFAIRLNDKRNSAFLAWGNVDSIAGEITRLEKEDERLKDLDENFMDNVYAALLPYALNKQAQKEGMLRGREKMALNKSSARGGYRYYHLASVPWLTDSESVIRQDAIYTQYMVPMEDEYIPEWITLPNIRYIDRSVSHRATDDGSDIPDEVYLLTEEQRLVEEQLSEYLRQNDRYRSIRPVIEEGYEYFVRQVPMEKYWEKPEQISKPAGDDTINKYLQVKDDTPLTSEKQALQLSAVLVVAIIVLIRIFI